MERIEDLLSSGCSQEYQGRWLPSLPLPYYSLRTRLSDAWAVFTYRAAAVQWPHQRDEAQPHKGLVS